MCKLSALWLIPATEEFRYFQWRGGAGYHGSEDPETQLRSRRAPTSPHLSPPRPSHKSLHGQTAPAGGQTRAEFSPVNRTPLCNEVGAPLTEM